MWKLSCVGLAVAAVLAASPHFPDAVQERAFAREAAPRAKPGAPAGAGVRANTPAPAAGVQKPQAAQPVPRHDLVVTATRLETPAREVASSVTVIAGTDLEKTKKPTVFEALGEVCGLAAIRNGGPGSASSVFIRGANSEHLLVLLDGVEVNDPINPSRSFDFAHLTLDNVDRIEVLRGPQSTLYGSDAMGGVINILTKKGRGAPRVTLATQGGSYGTFHSTADLGGSAGVLDYALGLSHFTTRGFSAASSAFPGNSEKDGYRNLGLSGRLGLTFKDGFEAVLLVRTTAAKTDLDNFGGPGGDDPNAAQDYASLFLRGQVRGLLAEGRWEQKLGFSFIHSNRTLDNPVDVLHPYDSERGTFQGRILRIDWQNNVFVHPSHTITFGADLAREQGDSDYRSTSLWGPYESPFPKQTADDLGFYVQDQIKIGGLFFAAAGVRIDRHSRTGTSLTYRLAPALVFDATRTKLKASLGTGFKSPSLYQLYAPATFYGPVGNTALKSEESLGWDVGIEQSLFDGALAAGLVYFRNDFRNLVDFDFSRGYVNIGRARTRGLELSAEGRFRDEVSWRASYTRLEAGDLDAGINLPRRPSDKFAARIDLEFLKAWAIDVSAVYTGARRDLDYSGWDARDVTLAGYLLLDGVLSFNAGRDTQVFVRLDNILGAKYETVFGYGTPGFSAYAGVRVGL
jgi:vitamin B12 transporter